MDDKKPMPLKLSETVFLLKSKAFIEGDDELEDFYAYDIVPDTEEYKERYHNQRPMEVYVGANRQSKAEFQKLTVGSKFKLIPTK